MTNFGLIAGISRFLNMVSDTCMRGFGSAYYDVDSATEILERYGFRILGAGSYRICVSHPFLSDVVFKVCYSLGSEYYDAVKMAKFEYEFYTEKATENDKRHMAKCYHAETFVSVMEYVKGRKDNNSIKHFFKAIGYKSCSAFWDAGYNNILMRDGIPILIDYTE